jgi:hypothetical protein
VLLRIDDAQALDRLEPAVPRLGDVHVHSRVVQAGHRLRVASRGPSTGRAGPLRQRATPSLSTTWSRSWHERGEW